MKIEVVIADYLNAQHAKEIALLLNSYAEDPMGGGIPLTDFVIQNLATELSNLPNAFSVICYVNGKPAGLINCFQAFSTFQCKPLINIHDIVVTIEFRGLGISQLMLKNKQKIKVAVKSP